MKPLYTLAFGAMALVAVATSCSKKKLEVVQGAMDQTALITAHITSAATNLPIEAVSLSPISNPGQVSKTNNLGITEIRVNAGSTKIKLSCEGYASIFETLTARPINGESDTPIFGKESRDIKMYPMTGTLRGRVLLTGVADQNNHYIEGATVRVVKIGNVDVADVIQTTVGAGGLFEFSVPTIGAIELLVSYTSPEGVVYQSRPVVTLKDGEKLMTETVRLQPVGGADFGADIITEPKLPSEPLCVTFPVAIDKDKTITVTVNGENHPLTSVTFKDEDRTLMIVSKEVDKQWVLSKPYNCAVTAKSVEGGNLSEIGMSFTIK